MEYICIKKKIIRLTAWLLIRGLVHNRKSKYGQTINKSMENIN